MKLEVTITEKEKDMILNSLLLWMENYPEDKKAAKSAYHKMFDADVDAWCRKLGIERVWDKKRGEKNGKS